MALCCRKKRSTKTTRKARKNRELSCVAVDLLRSRPRGATPRPCFDLFSHLGHVSGDRKFINRGRLGTFCDTFLVTLWHDILNLHVFSFTLQTHQVIEVTAVSSLSSAAQKRCPYRALSASPACRFLSLSALSFLFEMEKKMFWKSCLSLMLIDNFLLLGLISSQSPRN